MDSNAAGPYKMFNVSCMCLNIPPAHGYVHHKGAWITALNLPRCSPCHGATALQPLHNMCPLTLLNGSDINKQHKGYVLLQAFLSLPTWPGADLAVRLLATSASRPTSAAEVYACFTKYPGLIQPSCIHSQRSMISLAYKSVSNTRNDLNMAHHLHMPTFVPLRVKDQRLTIAAHTWTSIVSSPMQQCKSLPFSRHITWKS